MSSLTMPLGESINRRASARAGFGTGVLSLEQLSLLLAATYGSLPESQRRSVPSGGALYPLSVYVAVLGRAEIAPGIYWHDPVAHTLATIETHDPTSAINEAMISPSYVEGASAIVIVTAMFWRSRFKYGERGYRYVLLEAGHAMQNLLLAATASSIPALPLGGFFDDVIERLLRIDGVDEGVLYTCALGTSS
jgi:SagB-type dehydrogenase family enzyme